MKTKLIYGFLVGLLALAAAAGGIYAQRWLQASQRAESSASELDVAFPDFQGKPHYLNEWKGKILIVNLWASWCQPCVEEMPEFFLLQGELASKGVQFVGVLVDDELDIAQEFLRSQAVNYPILNGNIGGRQWSTEKLGNRAEVLPYSLVYDTTGKRIHTEVGRFTRDEVMRALQPLLK